MRSKLALILIAASLGLAAAAQAQVHVDGYYRQNGTYVAPHYRSAPDGNVFNNYSTRGNVNPYTGQMGTVNPYSSYQNPYGSYQSPPLNGRIPGPLGDDDN